MRHYNLVEFVERKLDIARSDLEKSKRGMFGQIADLEATAKAAIAGLGEPRASWPYVDIYRTEIRVGTKRVRELEELLKAVKEGGAFL